MPGRYDILLQTEEKKPTPPAVSEKQPASAAPVRRTVQPDSDVSERANARTVERPNGKHIITRNSFEIYEDQMDDLRELAFQEKRQGKLGSMSAMVRDAIDTYLSRSRKG
jgi:hypothetical protein